MAKLDLAKDNGKFGSLQHEVTKLLKAFHMVFEEPTRLPPLGLVIIRSPLRMEPLLSQLCLIDIPIIIKLRLGKLSKICYNHGL